MAIRHVHARALARSKRPDIQGMRALAILLVLVFHLWPDLLPGGFIGVDIFFVISGYLIIGGLSREAERTGTVDVGTFYVKRIRRLLPAAAVTIALTGLASLLLLPVSRLASIGRDMVFSSLQAQNWHLAVASGAYEQAGAAVSPLQHFWSLAVEEQFYIFIPLIVGIAALLARRRHARTAVVGVLVALLVASLTHSLLYSAQNPGVAYYSTFTRAWQLIVGGLTAVIVSRVRVPEDGRYAATAERSPVVIPMAAGAVLVILLSATLLSTTQPFLGWRAIPATLAAAVLLFLGSARENLDGAANPLRWMSSRPAVVVGDHSYSLYLVHWPIIVIALYLSKSATLPWPWLVFVLMLTVASTYSLRRLVEVPFQARRDRLRTPALAVPRVAAQGVALVAAGSLLGLGLTTRTPPPPPPIVEVPTEVADLYPGAAALMDSRIDRTPTAEVRPAPQSAFEDRGLAEVGGCAVADPVTETPDACVRGDRNADRRVVIVGDSHAAQWLTPLDAVSDGRFSVETMIRNGCPFSFEPLLDQYGNPFTVCADSNRKVAAALVADPPDVVVVSAFTPDGYSTYLEWQIPESPATTAGYEAALTTLRDAGIDVVVIDDPPAPAAQRPGECAEQHGARSTECTTPLDAVTGGYTPQVDAAEKLGIPVVSFTDLLCTEKGCPLVVGNVFVYRDNHMTRTFLESLAPAVEERLVPLLAP